ncbi:AraC family transcriptional regulator [Novosphingobium sp.]|uniref:AraC family transcriptional regulator n=1 Tax=Novosphingobium sp. TaxID=1874826 RepID=UPI001EB65397|nr:AraC family transcriptional regulator [Novosphingobium sp.]MBK6799978.1 AraC family transcriptional regulator ligand-binding domain-containing protein [Novosphingobium sp.]MBK9011009.1 AraC family transcriptional regulator ligand-binding domain-containing protein [Novosphingobium sp.]
MVRDSIPMARSAVLDGFETTARACGLDPASLLRQAGIPQASLRDPELPVPTASIVTLLEQAGSAAANPSFGLLMAQARGFSVLGLVALIMREQPDLRSALISLTRLGWAQAEALESSLEDDGETAILTLTLAPGLPRPATQTFELAVAAIVRLLRHFLGPAWSPQMLIFSHRRPIDTAPYGRCLGVTPVFRMERNSIVMLTADLDQPIAHADPAFGRQLERLVERSTQQRGAARSQQVSEAIRRMLPTGQCNAPGIADLFGVDRRTLHRWLADEGVSFSRLLDEARCALCAQYRGEGSHTLTEIAELLGFSSLSAYSRWRRLKRLAE